MNPRFKLVLYSVIILIIAYFTYFQNYWQPSNLFWDENYHIASAQKYLNGVFFMEPHPPLGKLFIALGEKMFSPNKSIDTSSFLTTDYIKDIPAGYSFIGVRFFPVLFAALSSVLFFAILYNLSGYAFISFLFTSLYLFENAIIVHSRGAMLESTQMFFALLLIWWVTRFVNALKHIKKSMFCPYVIAGLLYGLVISVKLNGIMLGFTLVIMLTAELYYLGHYKKILSGFILKCFAFICASAFVFIFIYILHIVIAHKPMQKRYYEASGQYKRILNNQYPMSNIQSPISKQIPIPNNQYLTTFIKNISLMFKEHIQFIFHYEKGVPQYDVCKVGENGSLPVTWPFGDKGINYRWENNAGKVKYLYLQGNPAIWGIGLLGIFFSINLFISYLFFNIRVKNKQLFFSIVSFLMLYVLYMGVVMGISRVMYLYHYFIPLILSLFLAYLIFLYFFEEQLKRKDVKVITVIIVITFIIVITYFFFSPLTYYQPLTASRFELRNWFPFWGLKSVK